MDQTIELQTYLCLRAGEQENVLKQALKEGADACLVLTEAEAKLDLAWLEIVIAACHDKEVAVLLQDQPGEVLDHGLDGLHLSDPSQVAAARKRLGDDLIIGCFCVDRHSAMLAGEAGADYLMFVDPANPEKADQELIDWWMEMMELPCIGSQNQPGDFQLVAL